MRARAWGREWGNPRVIGLPDAFVIRTMGTDP